MNQPTLFDLLAAEPEIPTWTTGGCGTGPLGSKGLVHWHHPTAMTVHHCGHPTANFPYYILTATGEQILAPNGRGFQRLSLAKQHVEQLHEESKRP